MAAFQVMVPLAPGLVFLGALASVIPLAGAPPAEAEGLQNLASPSAPSTSNNPPNPIPFHGSTPVASASQPPAFSFIPLLVQPSYEILTLQQHVKTLIENQRIALPEILSVEHRPPYPTELIALPNLIGYVLPKFEKFNGKTCNVREHVTRFIQALGVHGIDKNFCLRKFSKSLTERASTWYSNLPPISINTWEEMVVKFTTKFFEVEERLTIIQLPKETPRYNEDVEKYIKRFHDKSLNCHEPIEEKQLVQLCLGGMQSEYKVLLINLYHPILLAPL